MNKKGFTLVELLAVIVIMALLAAVATPIVLTVQKNIKNKMYTAKVKMIKESAILCVEKTNNIELCNTVEKLCTNEFLARDKDCDGSDNGCSCQKNPITGSSLDGCNIDVFKDNSNGGRWKASFPSSTETDTTNCQAPVN